MGVPIYLKVYSIFNYLTKMEFTILSISICIILFVQSDLYISKRYSLNFVNGLLHEQWLLKNENNGDRMGKMCKRLD